MLNALPGILDVACLRVGLPDAQAQRQLAIEFGVRQEKIAALIQAIHDGLIGRVTCFVAKTNQV